jgi:hypothetical protein
LADAASASPDVEVRTLRNAISITGAVLTTVSAVLFLTFFLLELIGWTDHSNPYLGIIFFIILPSIFIVGLLLIPLGAWLERRRRLRGLPPSLREWPRVDFNHPRTRTSRHWPPTKASRRWTPSAFAARCATK